MLGDGEALRRIEAGSLGTTMVKVGSLPTSARSLIPDRRPVLPSVIPPWLPTTLALMFDSDGQPDLVVALHNRKEEKLTMKGVPVAANPAPTPTRLLGNANVEEALGNACAPSRPCRVEVAVQHDDLLILPGHFQQRIRSGRAAVCRPA